MPKHLLFITRPNLCNLCVTQWAGVPTKQIHHFAASAYSTKIGKNFPLNRLAKLGVSGL